MTRKWWLYVLRLTDGKYYVGITTQYPQKRFDQHDSGFMAARWTKEHHPLQIIETRLLGFVAKEEAEETEQKRTREMMREHGLNNVRGGDLTDNDSYIVRLGRVFILDDWKTLLLVVYLMITILFLVLGKYNHI